MKNYVILITMLISTSAIAQVYKCTLNGKTVYADSPCSPQAGVINIRPGPAEPSESEIKSKAAIAEKTNKADIIVKRRTLDEDIERTQSSLDATNYQKEQGLAQLRAKKQQANNNLAGATWEQSISAEMQALVVNYEGKINRLQDTLNNLRSERIRLEKKTTQ